MTSTKRMYCGICGASIMQCKCGAELLQIREPRSNAVLFNLMIMLAILAVIVGIFVLCYTLPIRLVVSIGYSLIVVVAIGWIIRGLSR